MQTSTPPPSKIKLHRKSCILEVAFGEHPCHLSAEYLRVFSPSAEVKGHGPGQEVLQLNKENVAITGIEPQGNYAIKLIFSDGHDSGIYSWSYLKQLADNYDRNWADYQSRVNTYLEQEAERKENEDVSPVKWITPDNT